MFAVSVYALGRSPVAGKRIAQHIGKRAEVLATVGSYLIAEDGVSIDATRFQGETGLIGIYGPGNKETLLKIEKIG